MTSIALGVDSICASVANVPVLKSVRLSLRAGCWTCVVGPNGAGKSTLLKVMAGLLPSDSGRVLLHGQPLESFSLRQRARAISWLGQAEQSGDDLRVWDVAMLGRLPHQAWLAAPTAADRAAVEAALRATQAFDWRERALGQLSGGERQRVLLARALAVQADVLLMDEPLANLDPPHQADWLRIVRGLVAQGKTVVSVLHELTMALQADDVVVLANGQLRHHGSGQHGATHRAITAVFDERISVQPLNSLWVALPKM